jgi:hypothetical protein
LEERETTTTQFQGMELLTFSGNRETKEDRSGTKHIGATDLLNEMTRRRAANPDWDDAETIAHCARSFRNDVAMWWQEVVPCDNSPRQLKKIKTSWERFELIFRRVWIIETTLPPQAWLDNNPQTQEESLSDYITRVQEATQPAAMAERAIKGAQQHKKKEVEPPGNHYAKGGIATFDQKGVAPQKPQETIAAYVTRVQMDVATTSRDAITCTGNFVKDSNTPRWNNRTAKYLAAQTVFDKRAVDRPWTDREQAKINSRNNKYGREQQEAARYECRRIMTTVVTCQIVKNGLRDSVMHKVATKIAKKCTSTDGFKAKLTQIKNFNQQTKPKKNKTHGICQEAHTTITQYAIEKVTLRGIREGRELQKTENAIQQTTKRGSVERRERQKLRNQLECNICRQCTGNGPIRPHEQTMLVQHSITQRQHPIMRMVRETSGTDRPQRPHPRGLLATGRSECQTRRTPNLQGDSYAQQDQ